MLNRTLNDERGNVLVTAMILIGVMLGIGLAALARVDNQTSQSRTERLGESSFNLAEGALSQQIFILGRRGTGTPTNPYPARCPVTSGFCPDPAKITQNYDAATHQNDYDTDTRWYTWVRDNASAVGAQADTFWTDTLLGDVVTGAGGRPTWDQNGDKLMWVRAQAKVRGKERAIVGLIRIEPRPVTLPQYAILAGRFATTNNGIHSAQIVDTNGGLGVAVRCGPDGGTAPVNGCLTYQPNKGQIIPNVVQTGYDEPTTISSDDLESLVDVARANGTYYTSRPNDLSGDVVVLDPGGDTLWKYQANDTFNSPSNPGMIIMLSGKLEFTGTMNYYGLIYHANLGGLNDADLVKVHGNSQLQGGVIVDGACAGSSSNCPGVEAGSSGKLNIKFDTNAFAVNAFGTAGVVQNTWREIRTIAVP